MNTINKAVEASNMYESAEKELKKEYLLKYIDLVNNIFLNISGHKGTFGLGYPYYALGHNLEGELPIVEEQFRYNNQLLIDYIECNSNNKIWLCEKCLENSSDNMPNLKTICYKCPTVPMEIKPRKVINRLPDMDFCMVVEDGYEEITKKKIIEQFNKFGIETSDVDPVKTISDVFEIASDLDKGIMPKKYIPIDTHLFSYSELIELMKGVVPKIDSTYKQGIIPFLPTLPYSLRKVWQIDDQAINFVFDYIFSLTEYNFESNLLNVLKETRKELVSKYSNEEIEDIVLLTGPSSLPRRYKNLTISKRFNERINLWREE